MKQHLSRRRNGWPPTGHLTAGVAWWIALVLMVEIGHRASGQAPPASEGQVRIDALVTDRHGLPIEGLRATDFELRARGVPWPLRAVDFRTSPRNRPAPVSQLVTDVDEQRAASEIGTRVFVFVLDEFHLSPGASAARAVEIVDEFIDDKVHAHDLAVVVRSSDAVPTLRFTRDRARLHGVLASVSGLKEDFAPRTPLEAQAIGIDPASARVARRTIVSAKLRELALRLGQMQADRAVFVFVSEGFPDDGDDRPGPTSDLQHVVRASSQFHFPIYAFNPVRPDEDAAPPADRDRAATMLRRLAEQTGGLFISADTAIAGFARIAHDTEAYYSLRCQMAPADGTLHPIDVRVKRAGASVRTRTVYWPDITDGTRALVSLPPASLAVPQRLLRRSELVDVWVGLRRDADGRGRMTVSWEPRARVSRSLGTVLVTARDMNGRTLFERPIAAVGGDKDVAHVAVPGGRVELDLDIRDDAGTVVERSARDVDVPDLRSSAKPGPRLLPPEIVRARTPRPLQELAADATPTATRTFSRATRLLIRTPAFDPTGAAVDIRARLLNRTGRSLYDIPVVDHATADRPAQFALPLAGLAADRYSLEIVASSAHGTATTRVGFRVAY